MISSSNWKRLTAILSELGCKFDDFTITTNKNTDSIEVKFRNTNLVFCAVKIELHRGSLSFKIQRTVYPGMNMEPIHNFFDVNGVRDSLRGWIMGDINRFLDDNNLPPIQLKAIPVPKVSIEEKMSNRYTNAVGSGKLISFLLAVLVVVLTFLVFNNITGFNWYLTGLQYLILVVVFALFVFNFFKHKIDDKWLAVASIILSVILQIVLKKLGVDL